MESPPAVMDRYLTNLADFTFDVEHRPGKQHVVADALSRHGAADPADAADHPQVAAMTSLEELTSMAPQDLVDGQREDEDISTVREWMIRGHQPDKAEIKALSYRGQIYAKSMSQLSFRPDGVLAYSPVKDNGQLSEVKLACVPNGGGMGIRVQSGKGGQVSETVNAMMMTTWLINGFDSQTVPLGQ